MPFYRYSSLLRLKVLFVFGSLENTSDWRRSAIQDGSCSYWKVMTCSLGCVKEWTRLRTHTVWDAIFSLPSLFNFIFIILFCAQRLRQKTSARVKIQTPAMLGVNASGCAPSLPTNDKRSGKDSVSRKVLPCHVPSSALKIPRDI